MTTGQLALCRKLKALMLIQRRFISSELRVVGEPHLLLLTELRHSDAEPIAKDEATYHGEWGVEAQFLKNEELLIGRRFDTRELAVRWAEETRQSLEKGWEDA
jgi:hypothetical protein